MFLRSYLPCCVKKKKKIKIYLIFPCCECCFVLKNIYIHFFKSWVSLSFTYATFFLGIKPITSLSPPSSLTSRCFSFPNLPPVLLPTPPSTFTVKPSCTHSSAGSGDTLRVHVLSFLPGSLLKFLNSSVFIHSTNKHWLPPGSQSW